MHGLSKNRMITKISNFHYLGLKELKCAVVCYFQGFYSVVWQFGTSAFHMVVLWQKLGEVENEFNSHNFSLLAIFLPKIIKFGGSLTKFWQIQICLVFWDTVYVCYECKTQYTKPYAITGELHGEAKKSPFSDCYCCETTSQLAIRRNKFFHISPCLHPMQCTHNRPTRVTKDNVDYFWSLLY